MRSQIIPSLYNVYNQTPDQNNLIRELDPGPKKKLDPSYYCNRKTSSEKVIIIRIINIREKPSFVSTTALRFWSF